MMDRQHNLSSSAEVGNLPGTSDHFRSFPIASENFRFEATSPSGSIPKPDKTFPRRSILRNEAKPPTSVESAAPGRIGRRDVASRCPGMSENVRSAAIGSTARRS